MNERPTPETDAECFVNEGDFVTGDFARGLERQRDEAREQLEQARSAWETGQLTFGIAPVPLSEAGVRITLQEIRDDKVNDALIQRDELLAALGKIAMCHHKDTVSDGTIRQHRSVLIAETAIAAVKGAK